MPITLGCPSCGKRFRARDESAGKKVKCPYCQAAVPVPTAEESATAGAPTAPLPPPPGPGLLPPTRPGPPPMPGRAAPAPVVASPDDWGALPAGAAAAPPAPPPPPPEPAPEPFPPSRPGPGARGKDRPKPARPAKGKGEEQTPEQILAAGWRATRRGLFWVQFALVWLALVGFVGFGKVVMVRSGTALPRGDGAEWVSIEGYVNDPGNANAVPLNKTELLDLALYGVPVLLAAVCVVFGRLIASGAPRSSGARGLFALAALGALVGFAALFGSFVFDYLRMEDERYYLERGYMVLLPLAEFWFLTGLTASGLALKRPRAARAVGAVGFVFALGAVAATLGWTLYVRNGRPKPVDDDVRMYEQAALMLGWLLAVGVYWRAVRNVRVAAQEYIDTVHEAA